MNRKLSLSLRYFFKKFPISGRKTLILQEFKQFPRVVILALLFTLLSAAFEGFGLAFLLTFLQGVTDPGAPPVETGIQFVDVWLLASNAPPQERLYRVSALIVIITLMRSVFAYCASLYASVGKFKLAYQLRLRIFEQLQSLPISYFAKTRSGELVNSITNEIFQIMQAFESVAVIIISGTTLLVYLGSMLLLSWQLTVVSIMLFGLLSVGISTLLGRVREASFARSQASGRYVSVALEFINGIRTVKAFGAQDFERKRFYRQNKEFLDASTRAVSFMSIVAPLIEGVATIFLIGLMLFSLAVLIPSGQLQIASLLTFMFVMLRMMPLVKNLNGTVSRFHNYYGSFDKITEILREDNKTYLKSGTRHFPGLQHSIEFRSVDFGYDPTDLVLKDITLLIEKGKTTALVGASGAGKSTLADLIPRFYDPTQGQILVDGTNLQAFDTDSIRHKLAVVSQDTFIFNDTIRNNIAYALEDVDPKAIERAARQSNALHFIQEMPQGFDTVLGDRGVRLSGGQRQRIAIARALLRDPEILILDEATSALDSVSEQLIQDSIESLSKGRTVIAIAHRLSTISNADKIVVLEQGEIVEQGSYEELLRQQGKLWNYHQAQNKLTHAG
ncbi:MAG: heterocyst formation ABC transporter subunit HepA [Phormidesmis sp.]